MHLGIDVMQVCTCMASCWKLALAAILLFTFEIEGSIGAGMYRCYCGLQVLCALYLCPLTCTYGYAILHTVYCILHTAWFSVLQC